MSGLRGVIDSHCHLDQLPGWRASERPDVEGALVEVGEILGRARAAGVEQVVTPGCAWPDFPAVRAVSDRFDTVWTGYGIHPHDASSWADGGRDRLAAAFDDPKALAVGECGLDYHYDLSPRESQREAFRSQIRLARELGKPLIVHARAAEADTRQILTEENGAEVGGVMHCFTGSADLARACLELGFYVSFSGILAFAKSADLRDVARIVPLERTLAETDAPYLAPPPHRGKRNEPAFVVRVIEVLAEIHGRPAQELADITARNARTLFRLPWASETVSSLEA